MKAYYPSRQYLITLVLRISLAFAFLYAAFLGFSHSFEWIGYFPGFIRDHFPDTVILNLFGLSDLVIAGWLLWGRKIFIPSVVSGLYLLASVLFNLDQFNDLFRNLSILGIAFALAILSYPRIIPKSKL